MSRQKQSAFKHPNDTHLGQGDSRPLKRLKTSNEEHYVRDILVKEKCILACDSLDFDGLAAIKPQYTAITPRTLLQGLRDETNKFHVWIAVKAAMESTAPIETQVQRAIDLSLVELGVFQLTRYPGCHFTFIDPRIAQDENAIVEKVQSLSERFLERGITRSEIVFDIPATISGIKAARTISLMPSPANQVKINLTMVQGLIHAATCVEANPFAVTLAVGRVLRWREAMSRKPISSLHPLVHPGMSRIHAVRQFFRHNNIPTKLLAGGFRQLGEVKQLLNFPGLMLSLPLMKELRWATTESVSDVTDEPILPTELDRAVASVRYPGRSLENAQAMRQRAQAGLLVPPGMSAHTQKMAEHNVKATLDGLKKAMDSVEAYVRREVVNRDAVINPARTPTPGAKTEPCTPEDSKEADYFGSFCKFLEKVSKREAVKGE